MPQRPNPRHLPFVATPPPSVFNVSKNLWDVYQSYNETKEHFLAYMSALFRCGRVGVRGGACRERVCVCVRVFVCTCVCLGGDACRYHMRACGFFRVGFLGSSLSGVFDLSGCWVSSLDTITVCS